MSRKPSKSTAKKAWKTRKANKAKNLEPDYEGMIKATTPEVRTLSFADCIFQIINSTMDQSAKVMAFDAMKVAAANMRF